MAATFNQQSRAEVGINLQREHNENVVLLPFWAASMKTIVVSDNRFTGCEDKTEKNFVAAIQAYLTLSLQRTFSYCPRNGQLYFELGVRWKM